MYYLFVRGSAVEEVDRGENSDVREQLQSSVDRETPSHTERQANSAIDSSRSQRDVVTRTSNLSTWEAE
ncbi:hypothetical protein U0070_020509 [Myodes glareolus]|uniref:Uncharacterized protein n=1 Tax=Myodes glareolus TaxID=447135 RepID=A0AAW0JB19_MYOGA